MDVLVVDVDSKKDEEDPQNLALKKLSAFHKAQGDRVGFDIENPDKVYISCIFSKNKAQAKGIASFYPDAEIDIGGSGIDLNKKLPEDIENIKPDYDLYPSNFSQGFTTRGCIRKCPFCIVPEKEGKIRIAQHPSEFHDERFKTCMIMDNNLFAAPDDWQKSVFDWFIDNKIKMLSPQGWDIRLLTEDRARTLKKIKHVNGVQFAWDNTNYESAVVKGLNLLKKVGFDIRHNVSFYVLAGADFPGYNPSFEDALYRCNRLREMGTSAFVMPYHKRNKSINKLAKWADRRWAYWASPFSLGRVKA